MSPGKSGQPHGRLAQGTAGVQKNLGHSGPAHGGGLSPRHGSITDQLTAWGLFNNEGHLRFYRHTLLIPWFDGGHPVYLQARATDPEVSPPELSLTGPVPCPYNARLLDGSEGRLYLCTGSLDTLELLEAGFPAVGVPSDTDLKPAWLPRFRNKSVFLAFDADAAGEAAAAKAIALLTGQGIDAHRLRVPAGKRVGDWLAGK